MLNLDVTQKLIPNVTVSDAIDSAYSAYFYINEAKKYYPGFDVWYFLNVLPELSNGNKKIIYERDPRNLKGLAIIKPSEKKICHLSVMPNYRNKGIGIRLFKKCFEELETNMPFFSVSEEKLPEFQRVFDWFGFKQTDAIKGYYRPEKTEYFYNQSEVSMPALRIG